MQWDSRVLGGQGAEVKPAKEAEKEQPVKNETQKGPRETGRTLFQVGRRASELRD